jgi:hypothetical protein
VVADVGACSVGIGGNANEATTHIYNYAPKSEQLEQIWSAVQQQDSLGRRKQQRLEPRQINMKSLRVTLQKLGDVANGD